MRKGRVAQENLFSDGRLGITVCQGTLFSFAFEKGHCLMLAIHAKSNSALPVFCVSGTGVADQTAFVSVIGASAPSLSFS